MTSGCRNPAYTHELMGNSCEWVNSSLQGEVCSSSCARRRAGSRQGDRMTRDAQPVAADAAAMQPTSSIATEIGAAAIIQGRQPVRGLTIGEIVSAALRWALALGRNPTVLLAEMLRWSGGEAKIVAEVLRWLLMRGTNVLETQLGATRFGVGLRSPTWPAGRPSWIRSTVSIWTRRAPTG